MNALEFVVLFCSAAIGLVAVYFSYQLGLTHFGKPGAGLFPFIIGWLLFGLAAALIVSQTRTREFRSESVAGLPKRAYWALGSAVYASLLAYAYLLPRAGFLVSSLLLLFVLMKFVGQLTSLRSATLSLAVVVPLYVVLVRLLKMPLPVAEWF